MNALHSDFWVKLAHSIKQQDAEGRLEFGLGDVKDYLISVGIADQEFGFSRIRVGSTMEVTELLLLLDNRRSYLNG